VQEIYWTAEKLVASQEGPCCVELWGWLENEAGKRIGIRKGILMVFSKLYKNSHRERTLVRTVPQGTTVKYLGINLDCRLTWKPHIHKKRKQLGLLLQRMYWIMGRKSKLSLTNKLPIYKIILNPIWTYGISLWWTASQSNIEILQRLQNRILRMATNAPRYVPNHALNTDLQMPTIREEITRLSSNYKAKIEVHPNKLTTSLFEKQGPGRLRRHSPIDLPTRFIT